MNQRRWISLGLLLLCLLNCTSGICETKFDDKDHNRWTEEILFGNPSYRSSKPESIVTAIDCLEDALLLCIDQFNMSYQRKLDSLNMQKIPGIPTDISAIDFSAGTNHRVFTHRGWYHVYADFEIQRGHADVRKQLLFAVVNHVFSFEKDCSSPERAEKVCDSMCCLLYVTHILGDRYHSKAYYGANSTLLLAEETESIIHDLLVCLPVLFLEQEKTGDGDYKQLINGLRNLSSKILRERRQATTNEELLEIDKRYSVDVKALLVKYIPNLLNKQSWFTTVFPTSWSSN